jgi:hypothetical protein
VSMAPILLDAPAQSPKKTQFYSMFGTRAVWRDGWQANTVHAPCPSGWGHFDQDQWRLYNLHTDRNQMHDRAAEMPDVLDELKALWDAQARQYNGYPLDDRTVIDFAKLRQPSVSSEAGQVILYPGGSEIPEHALQIIGRSFTIIAWLTVETIDCEGVIFAGGGRFGGHSLFIKDRHLHYVYNVLGQQEQKLTAPDPIGSGHMAVGFDFAKTAHDGPFPSGTGTLHINQQAVATMPMRVQPAYFSLAGEGSNVGRDRGQPVSAEYRSPFALTGATIDHVLMKAGDDVYIDLERHTEAAFRRD